MKFQLFFVFLVSLLISCSKPSEKPSQNPQLIEFKEITTESARKGKPVRTPKPGRAVMLLHLDGYYDPVGHWNGTGVWGPSNISNQAAFISDIALYFSQWNLEVTTDVNRWNSYPANKRGRVIVTDDMGSVGGAAQLESIVHGEDVPAVVWISSFNNDARLGAAAVAHEFAHGLGNRHKAQVDPNDPCVVINPYYPAPYIMGAFWNYPDRPIWTSGFTGHNCGYEVDQTTIGKVISLR